MEVFYKDENVWRTQKAMSALFDCDRSVITKHLGNIFASEELKEEAVCAKFAHTASDGKSYQTLFFSPCGRVDRNTESNSEMLTSTEAHV